MNYEEGKGSIKLILAIGVIILVVFFGTRYAIDFFKKEDVKNMHNDILLVQGKIETVKANYSMNKEENPLKGYPLNRIARKY